MEYNFKYKVRFFEPPEITCFAQFSDSVIPQINTTVDVNNELYLVDEISYCYGHEDEANKFVLVDVTVSKLDQMEDY
jgi:hypothetical protein